MFEEKLLISVCVEKGRNLGPIYGEFDILFLFESLFNYLDSILFEWGGWTLEKYLEGYIREGEISLDAYLLLNKINKAQTVFYPENQFNFHWMYKRDNSDEIKDQMKDSFAYFSKYFLPYCQITDFLTYYEMDKKNLKYRKSNLLYELLYLKKYDEAIELSKNEIKRIQSDIDNYSINDERASLDELEQLLHKLQKTNNEQYDKLQKKLNEIRTYLDNDPLQKARLRELEQLKHILEQLENKQYEELHKKVNEIYEENKNALCNILRKKNFLL